MTDSILSRYVLDGGWSMLLLVPASVVSLAVAARGAWILRPSAIAAVAATLPQSPPQERSDAAYVAALQLFGTLQPLVAMYVLAPLIGLIGSITTLMPVQAQLLAPGARQLEVLTRIYQQALIPSFWGVTISAFSYAAFALLRARIFQAEVEQLR